jgi:DNA-binding XRE family transcriptional regulator
MLSAAQLILRDMPDAPQHRLHPDDDPDVPDLRQLGPVGTAIIDFENERAIYLNPSGRLLGVETRYRLVKVVRRGGEIRAQVVARVGTRPRERRESTRRRSSDSPPGDPDHEPEPALGRIPPGERVARLRVERGFSQDKAAALAGINQPSWSRIESGIVVTPRPATKAEVARVLGVKVSDIWRVAS